jgi:hypothetical protein
VELYGAVIGVSIRLMKHLGLWKLPSLHTTRPSRNTTGGPGSVVIKILLCDHTYENPNLLLLWVEAVTENPPALVGLRYESHVKNMQEAMNSIEADFLGWCHRQEVRTHYGI